MKPLICIPMGDPSGVGPEIALAAMLEPSLAEKARMIVTGNLAAMKRAAQCLGREVVFNVLTANTLDQARDGVCNIIESGNPSMSGFDFGKVSATSGRAAFDAIVEAVELAKAGKVDAMATTPINKEALKAAHVDYIGHTEILADLTGAKDPLTMFQVHNLRVFFLTRHMSLIDACRAVKRDLVYARIKSCVAALERLGLAKPSMAVAGLNPHSGEHGLFGDEEEREIRPAIEAARAEGYNVVGPNPADSVFHFALKGAFDCVLSLYHDQGHIATKMVDFERTISITHGLPFLRTSVDHGTAFDIAGTGKASPVSMVEAVRLAALYAPAFLQK